MADGMSMQGNISQPVKRNATLVAGVACLLCSAFTYAEELTDPTRPPVSILQPVAVTNVAPQPVGLQSILISKVRRVAIIDGQAVQLGEMYQGDKLVAVNISSVVLSGANGRKVLLLYPDVQISTRIAEFNPEESTEKSTEETTEVTPPEVKDENNGKRKNKQLTAGEHK